jgi:hypothetical protein
LTLAGSNQVLHLAAAKRGVLIRCFQSDHAIGTAPVQLAAREGHVRVVRRPLEAGASVDIARAIGVADSLNETAARAMMSYGHCCVPKPHGNIRRERLGASMGTPVKRLCVRSL